MLKAAMRTLRLGMIPFGLAACAIQMPVVEGVSDPDPNPPPDEMDFYIPTGDNADRVHVVSEPTSGRTRASPVWLCLELVNVSWWKGIGIGRSDPTLEVQDNKNKDCTNVRPEQTDITFWKAKLLGVHTRLSTVALNLQGYGGYTVSLRWTAD
jgi:hypothetical protein